MSSWPSPGARVSIRYRRAGGSSPPYSDVVGILQVLTPQIVVATKAGEIVTIAPGDVVAVRELSATPVRTREIRQLQYAMAAAWPGREHQWHDGWLMRASGGSNITVNCAVPLDFSAHLAALNGVIDFYVHRGLTPWLALPQRLLMVRASGHHLTRVMTREYSAGCSTVPVHCADSPDSVWISRYDHGMHQGIPADVLTTTLDATVAFTKAGEGAAGRGAVTTGLDGTCWLGISTSNAPTDQLCQDDIRTVCEQLQTWGAHHGAYRAYVQVLEADRAAITLFESLGFRLHHHYRYIDARTLITSH